ncbi:tRNA modification GTPase MnmE [Hartmannibacter diazotrophicus]|uniref:tRNA modification GTPase MnmE n=1 Tax=Hartmannibacter diazotrophicus TaxID=1482074 RepID=A0A2C9DE89_9HYPH|nr:tRNA uridine-5-carboxymethylaminomethyl(34) synthesis GTPase MnmE [Hartmannibacter diazotrophicus]SON58181.1 tRNA modification GTPase MnmE [Hartmannibacter diazotrophicus]
MVHADETTDTIFALSSGAPPSGIAVIRLSGPRVRFGLEKISGSVPPPRRAVLRAFRDPADGGLIDRGLLIFFEGPASATGEDMAELHLHGGRAVVAAMLRAFGSLDGLRLAQAGDFTRRAFENGKLDLTEVEGIADLIDAETEAQRRQALRQADGGLAVLVEGWRSRLLHARAMIEAELDFSDEEDVPGSVADSIWSDMGDLADEVRGHLVGAHFGERLRSGFEVALVGPPNAGKSSLLNALSRRDVAIVTDIPGTTRDSLEVHLDLGGYPVTLVDTAGLREGADVIEAEGIRRARQRAEHADLVLWLTETGEPAPADLRSQRRPVWAVQTKRDLVREGWVNPSEVEHSISVRSGEGLDDLIRSIGAFLAEQAPTTPSIVTRERQRRCLEDFLAALDIGVKGDHLPLELRAEHLREAGDILGILSGRIGVEDVLGVIFASFCVGK